jgi:hypothetical protein
MLIELKKNSGQRECCPATLMHLPCGWRTAALVAVAI